MAGKGYNIDRQKGLSDQTTMFRGNVQIGGVNMGTGASNTVSGYGNLSVASNIQVVAGPLLSKGSVDLFTNAVKLSMATAATSSGATIGVLTVVFAASGVSLVYSSGKTEYIIGGSATSGVQP